jgi:hypothetical protein
MFSDRLAYMIGGIVDAISRIVAESNTATFIQGVVLSTAGVSG